MSFHDRWKIRSKVTAADCIPFGAHKRFPPPQLIAFHYITKGHAHIECADGTKGFGQEDDLLILPNNQEHYLFTDDTVDLIDVDNVLQSFKENAFKKFEIGNSGKKTTILCGFIATESGLDLLTHSLPSFIKISLKNTTHGDWIEASIRHIISKNELKHDSFHESNRRILELIFHDSLEFYTKVSKSNETMWLSGIQDSVLSKALYVLHKDIDKKWTLKELAAKSATSQSVLSKRFQDKMGISPMRYIRERKLIKGIHQIKNSDRSITEIAITTGYTSVAAFSKAIKTYTHQSPKELRLSAKSTTF